MGRPEQHGYRQQKPVRFEDPDGQPYRFNSQNEACAYFEINRTTVRQRLIALWPIYDAYTKPIKLSCRSRFTGDRADDWVPKRTKPTTVSPTKLKGWGYA